MVQPYGPAPALPPAKLWALALAGVLTEMNGNRHEQLGGVGGNPNARSGCARMLADFYGVEDKDAFDEMVHWLATEGHSAEAKATVASLGPNPLADAPKQSIARAYAREIGRVGLLAWDAGRLVAVVGWGVWAGYVDEGSAWPILLGTASRVQKAYASWQAYGQAYKMGRLYWSGGASHEGTERALQKLAYDPSSPWLRLPWGLDLGAVVWDPNAPPKARFKKSVCPSCGGHKTRPSATAYVYCDFCGALADFDFQKACETPAERPGPAYEALAAQLMPMLEATKARGDVVGHRQLQLQLFDNYVTMCPKSVPLRVGDPTYRRAYVAYMAEAATAASFDPVAQQHAANVARSVQGLAFFPGSGGSIRVQPHGFHVMCEAFFAQEAHNRRLYEARGIYAMQPDRAPAELQQRMGMSLFVQGWLPMLDEQTSAQFLARTGLSGEYVEVDPPTGEKASCTSCGADLELLPGAKRVVCETCGHRCEGGAAKMACHGCGAPLAPTEGSTTVSCPHCRRSMQRVQMMRPG